jgi:hypothetical protein
MNIIQKLKHHYLQDLETLSDEEIEEFTPASPRHKMATCAPLVHIVPNNNDDYE